MPVLVNPNLAAWRGNLNSCVGVSGELTCTNTEHPIAKLLTSRGKQHPGSLPECHYKKNTMPL